MLGENCTQTARHEQRLTDGKRIAEQQTTAKEQVLDRSNAVAITMTIITLLVGRSAVGGSAGGLLFFDLQGRAGRGRQLTTRRTNCPPIPTGHRGLPGPVVGGPRSPGRRVDGPRLRSGCRTVARNSWDGRDA